MKKAPLILSSLCISMLCAPIQAQESLFPIWGKEARELGHNIPNPYGFSVSYMDMSQPIVVQSIELSGAPLLEALAIDAPNANFDGYNVTARGDLWVFPFLNVYGIMGYTSGDSIATIRGLQCDPTGLGIIERGICALLNAAGENIQGAPFALELQGGTYGAGATIAGGIGNWFALLDSNFTYTSLGAIDGDIRTVIVAPRAGYRWEFGAGRELRLFAGAMYQKVDQDLQGNIVDLSLPQALKDLIADSNGQFNVQQNEEHKWNTVIGAMYALNENWEVLIESGFGERKTSFMSVGYRF